MASSSGEVLMLSNKASLSSVPPVLHVVKRWGVRADKLRYPPKPPGRASDARRLYRSVAALVALTAAMGLGLAGGCGSTDVLNAGLGGPTDDCGNQLCAPDETCTTCAPDCGV